MGKVSSRSGSRATGDMRVAYFIFSNAHGTGGHHHSLKAISSSLKANKEVDVHIVNFGIGPSPVLSNMSNYVFYKVNEFTIALSLIKALLHCYKLKIRVLHAFDVNAYFYVRFISYILKIPSIYTKCGGANEKYNPTVEFATTFSGENFDFLLKQKKHKYLFLIENRVPLFKQNIKKTSELKEMLAIKDRLTFLRIIRISNYYKSSILTTIRFVSNFPNSILVFIGSIYDDDLYNEIIKEAKSKQVRVFFLTDELYTKDAKIFLDLGDIIFGTGRAAMEAMSTGKPLLSFVKGVDYPVCVDIENINDFKYYNFSERVKLGTIPPKENVVNFINNVNSNHFNSGFLKEEFNKTYFVDTRINDYMKIYHKALSYKLRKVYKYDFLLNFYNHFIRASFFFNKLIKLKKSFKK